MIKKIGRRSIAVIIALGLLIVPFAATPVSADVTNVEILQPLTNAKAYTSTGGAVDVTVAVTVNSSDYYMVAISINDGSAPTPVPIGGDSVLMQLNGGTNVITVLVPIAPHLLSGVCYNVDATADLPINFNPGSPSAPTQLNAVCIGDIPGAAVGAILVGKPILMTEALLDKFIPPSGVPEYLYDGNAYDLLSGEGKSLIDGIALLSSNGLGIAGGVVSSIRGGVTTYVPIIVNGALKLVADLLTLFSVTVPFAP